MNKISNQFAIDVKQGLTAFPKHLPSKYIYDKNGDKLFQDIMNMPEYYLTDCEFDILQEYKNDICKVFSHKNGFDLIELGAGDGIKTKILLKELVNQNIDFEYIPIDISQNALNELSHAIENEMPKVNINPQQGTYFEILKKLDQYRKRKKVILVLGSNIGNLLHDKAIEFLREIEKNMHNEDILCIGFDQKKHPQLILDAYNDPSGITERFNKNILHRINREFEGNFNTEEFLHWETYNPETGTALSYLVSKIEQNVVLKTLNLTIHFDVWETIHVEISQKYDDKVIQWLAKESKFNIFKHYTDSKKYFRNYIFKV